MGYKGDAKKGVKGVQVILKVCKKKIRPGKNFGPSFTLNLQRLLKFLPNHVKQ